VSNGSNTITAYAIPAPNALPSNLIATLTFPGYAVYGITVSDQALVWGTYTNGTIVSPPQAALQSGILSGFTDSFDTGNTLATEANGNVYIGNLDGSVSVLTSNSSTRFIQLNFIPFGSAIDNARGRTYISDDVDSTIAVYSTSGTLLHVIQ
jgi:hypothetical protein